MVRRRRKVCDGPDCRTVFEGARRNSRNYCSANCRVRAHRQRAKVNDLLDDQGARVEPIGLGRLYARELVGRAVDDARRRLGEAYMDEFSDIGGAELALAAEIRAFEVVDLGLMGYTAVDVSAALKIPALIVERMLDHEVEGMRLAVEVGGMHGEGEQFDVEKLEWLRGVLDDQDRLDRWTDARAGAGRGLTPSQTSAMMNRCGDDFRGLRDRALLMVFYRSCRRVRELVELDVGDVVPWWSIETGDEIVSRSSQSFVEVSPTLEVVVQSRALSSSLTKTLAAWLEARATVAGDSETALFVTQDGERLSDRAVQAAVAAAGERVGVKASPARLRVAGAAHFVQEGGSLEGASRLLGHRTLESTVKALISGGVVFGDVTGRAGGLRVKYRAASGSTTRVQTPVGSTEA